MRRFRDRWLRALILVSTAAFLGACTDQVPSSPDAENGLQASFAKGGKKAGQSTGLAGPDWEYTDEHLVLFEDGTPEDLEARVAALGGSVVRAHDEIGVAVVTGFSDEAGRQLARQDGVAAVPRDVRVDALPDPVGLETRSLPDDAPRTASHDPTNAPFFPFQWDMQIIDADDAWDAGFDDASGVTVAILDSGLDPFHVDMAGNIDAGNSVAFIPSTAPTGPLWGDDNSHGTHVGGTVVTNGLGTSGVAPHATLIAVKVCDDGGSCSFAAVMSGLVHAGSVGADVANMSLGGFLNVPSPGGAQLNAALNRAINFAQSQGTLVVSAAGNAAVDLDHIERDFGVNAFRAIPCENGAGMCVSATGPDDLLASYSNFGKSAVNVAGPGGDVSVTDNPLTGMVLAPCSSLAGLGCSTVSYLFAQGTSMATPHVAGAAALLDAQSGGVMNPTQLRSSLQRSADDLGKPGTDAATGKGRINVGRLLGAIQ